MPSRKADWLSGRGLATEEGAFPRGLKEGLGRYEAGVGPARNGSAVASRPSLPLSRTCHKGVAPPLPPPLSIGPGSWSKSVPQPSCRAPGSPWGRGAGGSPRAGDVGEGGDSPPVCGGETGLVSGEGSGKRPGKGGVWRSPGNSPEILRGGPRGRRLKRFLAEGVPP